MGRTPPIFPPPYLGRAEAVHAWGFGPLFVPFVPLSLCVQRNWVCQNPALLRPGTVAVARGAEVFQVFIRKLAGVRSERG